jgi:hypothetical protein
MQGLTVSLIVAAAAAYAAWQLMPQSMRRWLVGRLMVIAPSRRVWLARLEADAENSGCSSCKGCAADGQAPAPPRQAKIEVHRRGSN